MSDFSLREATEADLPAIFAIYNEAVLTNTATWDFEPVPSESWPRWLAEHQAPYCAIVAVDDADVVGWGSLSAYRPKPGYRFTVENTVYVRPDWHGKGIGNSLLLELLARARSGGFHSVVAKISGDNEVSIRLHARHGFVEAGREREAGYKFGRWLDLVTMQLMLEG